MIVSSRPVNCVRAVGHHCRHRRSECGWSCVRRAFGAGVGRVLHLSRAQRQNFGRRLGLRALRLASITTATVRKTSSDQLDSLIRQQSIRFLKIRINYGVQRQSHQLHWTPILQAATRVVPSEREARSDHWYTAKRRKSWIARYAIVCVFEGGADCIKPPLDFEVSLLRLVDKVTNGTVIEISYTGVCQAFVLLGVSTYSCLNPRYIATAATWHNNRWICHA